MTENEGDRTKRSIPYSTPEAFRRALTDRIAHVAESKSQNIAEIRRQFVYGRFLYRVFASVG